MNENFEKYIKDLSPELQDKARACKTKEELNAFIMENNLELPEEVLKLVSGGCGTSTAKKPYCKYCGAEAVTNTVIDLTPHLPGQPKIEELKPYVCWNGCRRHLDENEIVWK
ncbi:MAG: hypothetical protein J6O40_02440 [Ruminococcus sp.]|nr:hypothetical protein [Ruminococcus sp.]